MYWPTRCEEIQAVYVCACWTHTRVSRFVVTVVQVQGDTTQGVFVCTVNAWSTCCTHKVHLGQRTCYCTWRSQTQLEGVGGGEEHRLTIAFTKLQLRSVSFKRKSSRTGEHTCVCLCAFVHVYMCAYVAVYSAVCVVCVRDPVWLMWFCLKQVSEFCSHKIQEHDSIIKTTTLKRKQIYAITELVVCFKSSRLTAKFFITFFFKCI